jgi:polyisoprenoid-binding protein YceI
MKKYNSISIALLSLLLLSACGGEQPVKKEDKSEVGCFYTYNAAATTLEWTAFKFTEKKGVTGTFNEIIIDVPEGSDDPFALLSTLKFKLPTASVETQNEERNGKIASIFFKTLATDTIRGKVTSLNAKDGSAIIEIQMNGMTKAVKGTFTLKNADFAFSASIDILEWKGGPAIDALNRVCKELHTGSDGKSKLWSTVDLSFTTQLKSDCQ